MDDLSRRWIGMKRESIYERECASYGSMVGASVIAYALPRLNTSTEQKEDEVTEKGDLPAFSF